MSDETPQMMQANENQRGLYHGVRGHIRNEQCETLVPPCVESPAPPEPHAQAAAPSLADEGIEPRMSDEKPRRMMANVVEAAWNPQSPCAVVHAESRACAIEPACQPVESPAPPEPHAQNPEHWRSRCEMLETEVERLRKGAMQHAKEWMESAAEALAQENENARLRAELTAERDRHAEDRAIAAVVRDFIAHPAPGNIVCRPGDVLRGVLEEAAARKASER
jgi:hypothetical protein